VVDDDVAEDPAVVVAARGVGHVAIDQVGNLL
jgi:hypothetical protein